ncbi:hypothetical protein NHF46_21555 [Arthrobacter alpinus]|nr:hypothetical protein [Arthrobacter alpinus]
MLLRDRGTDPQSGYVLILAGGDISATRRQNIEDDIKRRLPEMLGRFNEAASEPVLESAMAGGGGSDSGAGGFAQGRPQMRVHLAAGLAASPSSRLRRLRRVALAGSAKELPRAASLRRSRSGQRAAAGLWKRQPGLRAGRP